MDRSDINITYMKQALLLAKKGAGRVSPNPMVGAVIVKNGSIAGKGYHRFFGGPHAEVEALRNAGEKSIGADMYVNLEPCCHYGKTPPCTDSIIQSAIKRIFVGIIDPNPSVSGGGIKKLREAGIEVRSGILEKECRKLNEAFIKFTTEQMPFVTLKTALTLDGKSATSMRDSKWISGERSRAFVHKLRSETDAVMVGVDTVIEDNPQLTVRLDKYRKKQPLRIVVDSNLRIPLKSRLLGEGALIATLKGNSKTEKALKLESIGAEIIETNAKKNRVDLKSLLKVLSKRNISSILIEGGSELNSSALDAGIVDKVIIFYAPKIIGGSKAPGMVGGEGRKLISEAIQVENISTKRIDKDLMLEGYVARS